jgi:hypothetical protein
LEQSTQLQHEKKAAIEIEQRKHVTGFTDGGIAEKSL